MEKTFCSLFSLHGLCSLSAGDLGVNDEDVLGLVLPKRGLSALLAEVARGVLCSDAKPPNRSEVSGDGRDEVLLEVFRARLREVNSRGVNSPKFVSLCLLFKFTTSMPNSTSALHKIRTASVYDTLRRCRMATSRPDHMLQASRRT